MARLVLFAGGTGNTGSAAVNALSAKGVLVRVLSRDPESDKAKKLASLEGVTIMKGDLAHVASLPAAFEGVQAAFLCCSNTKDQVQMETAFIDAAAACSSCNYLVKIGTCGSPGYTTKDSEIEYARFHAQTEEHLAASSLQWTVLRPNYFMQNHMGDIFGTLPKNLVIYPMPPDAGANVVDTRDVGEVAAALLCLADASAHDNQFYDVCGPESVDTRTMASLYSEFLGREITAIQVPREDFAKAAEGAGFPDWLAVAVSVGMDAFWGAGKQAYPSSPAVLELCPPQRTMKQWIEEHIPLSPPPAQ